MLAGSVQCSDTLTVDAHVGMGNNGFFSAASLMDMFDASLGVGDLFYIAANPFVKNKNTAQIEALEKVAKTALVAVATGAVFGMAAGKIAGKAGILDEVAGLAAGRSSRVRVVESADELTGLFDRWSAGGRVVEGTTYPGRLVELPDGMMVGLRQVSRSGGPTIDLRIPNGQTFKVHVGQ